MNRVFWFRALAVALTLSVLWGVSQFQTAEELKLTTENQYRRSFSDLITHLDSIESNLAKSRAAGTPTQQILYLSQTWRQSETAVKDISQLPADQIGISYIDRFLNQVGEFSRILTMQVAKGDPIEPSQEETLTGMHEQMTAVNNAVQELYVTMSAENIPWINKSNGQAVWRNASRVSPAAAKGDEEDEAAKPDSVRSGLSQLDSTLQKLPPFAYSGQEDIHSVPEPLGLPKGVVNQEESRNIAIDFLKAVGYPDASPEFVGTTNGPFSGYTWRHQNAFVDICKLGGVVTLYRDERPLTEDKLNIEQTVNAAMKTLKLLGWHDFIKTSTEDFGSYIQLEAVNQVNSIPIYPDKIRLTVARDNGQVTGYDATPYWLFNRDDRSYQTAITREQARAKLRPSMSVKESKLAYISLPGWQEALCYEFRTIMGDEEYLIYINATNGTEEKIQRIIRTPRGEFLQ